MLMTALLVFSFWLSRLQHVRIMKSFHNKGHHHKNHRNLIENEEGIKTTTPFTSNSPNVLENGAGKFKIDIDGAPIASANVESITIEDLVIDEIPMTTGTSKQYFTHSTLVIFKSANLFSFFV